MTAGLVDRDDVRMGEARERLGLAAQPILELTVEPGPAAAHLDGDRAVELGIARAIDAPHRAVADELGDHEPADAFDRFDGLVGGRAGDGAGQREHQVAAAVAVGDVDGELRLDRAGQRARHEVRQLGLAGAGHDAPQRISARVGARPGKCAPGLAKSGSPAPAGGQARLRFFGAFSASS